MDDSLLAEFHSVFSVTGDVNAPTRPHPAFSSLYKQRGARHGEQEARRRRLLADQRVRRRDRADCVRRIAEGEEWEEEMEEEEEKEKEGDQVDSPPVGGEEEKKKKKKVPRRRVHPYRNQLMLSEWLVDVPPDFAENWHMTVCPVGKRSLVVASKRTTTAYSRTGTWLNCFPSLLPGGCHKTFHTARDYCVLDCIYHDASRTYHILDILCWAGHPVCDSDREFRVYWLRTKLAETQKVTVRSRINPYVFSVLESYSCSNDAAVEGSMARVLSEKWPLEVDGLLFFHKESHYVSKRSPCAVWLKPHMVPEILGVPVSNQFLECAPQMSNPLATPTSLSSGKSQTRQTEQTQQMSHDGEECVKTLQEVEMNLMIIT